MSKVLLVLLTTLLSNVSYADNTIFKCTDLEGNTSYLNIKNKTLNCTKTDLANIDKTPMISSSKPKIASGAQDILNIPTKDDEQQVRDTKRLLVLKKELNDEQEQLDTVNTMLQKIDNKDVTQFNKLKEMQTLHQQNIASLNKELGNIKPVNLLPVITTPVINSSIPSFLPTSLPSGVNILNVNSSAKPTSAIKSNIPPKLNKIENKNLVTHSINTSSKKEPLSFLKPEANSQTDISPSQFLLGK